jgi:LysR family transcriptional regulator, glycine cleavage system transcriptional activator
MKQLVHLNAMRAFEASARRGSFSAAAKELNVTPEAIGQQVRSLENWLGKQLFQRNASGPSRLILTEAAQRALPDIEAGFNLLSLALGLLRDGAITDVLSVTVCPVLAEKWLLPRIGRFRSLSPDIDIRLDINVKLLDFVEGGIDVGMRYGAGVWPGLVAERLMGEEEYPVCAPSLYDRLREPADLATQTLIHDTSLDVRGGFATWDTWLESAGIRNASTNKGLHINNSASVHQAAIAGLGVALARGVMARDDIKAGRLVRLFPAIDLFTSLSYYAVYRPEIASLSRLIAFRDWLFEEAKLTSNHLSAAVTQAPPIC